jgi:hypothetical protein
MADSQRIVRATVGEDVIVQIEARGSSGEADVGAGELLKFDGVIKAVESIASSMNKALSNVRPDKATVEFGVDASVESGGLTALIVKGTGSATLKITLEWGKGA